MMNRLALVILAVAMLIAPASLAQSPLTPDEMVAWDEERFEELSSQGDPVKEEQFVYSITPWAGSQIGQGTIAVQNQDTIYLIADEINLMNARITDIYYWPITKEYMANWNEKNITVEGSLRVRQGNQVVATLEPETYVYYYRGGASGAAEVVLGDEGIKLHEEYEAALDAYWDISREYYEAQIAHQAQLDEILRYVQSTGEYVAEDEVPKSPRQPTPPTDFAYAPRTAFVVNLPKGNYQIEMVDPNGDVIPGTTKNLVVFEPRRVGVGYEIVPEATWTRPRHTSDRTEVIYLDGRRVFYLAPVGTEEYNVYQYYKSQNLHEPLYGEGWKSSWFWLVTEPIDLDVTLQLLRNGEVVREVPFKPYYVQQTSGFGLGYNILEFDRDNPLMYNRSPSFYGYRIDVEVPNGSYMVQLVDAEGNVLPGSVREIRSVRRDPGAFWTMMLVPVVPMVIGMGVYIRRRRLRPRAGKKPVSV